MGLNKIWNARPRGIIAGLLLGVKIVFRKISDILATFLFRNNIAECGEKVYVGSGLEYRYPSTIKLGNGIVLGNDVKLLSENLSNSSLIIKDNVSIGDRCYLDFSGGLSIGQGVHLAHNVKIITHDHGYDYRAVPTGKPLFITDNAFIGSDVIILFNCHYIGKNAVVGMGSVVTKDVPDNAIVVGNPARIIKYLNNEDTII